MSPSRRKSKNLFSSSIKPKENISFQKMGVDKLKSSGFTESTAHILHVFELHNENVKHSKRIDELQFTNYLSNTTESAKRDKIAELGYDLSYIDNDKGDQVRLNDRIKSCLALYIDQIEIDENIFKIDLSSFYSGQTGVRIFVKCEVSRNDEGQFKAAYKIIMIDPFHLVIPSQFNGFTKEYVMNKTFRENIGNNLCISTYFDK